MIIVSGSDYSRSLLDFLTAVFHGNAQAGRLQHGKVIELITGGKRMAKRKLQVVAKPFYSGTLPGGGRKEFKIAGRRVEDG